MDAPSIAQDVELLVDEHHVLMRHIGRAQVRCSEQLRTQADEIDRLRRETMRLRARLMLRDTAIAWACQDRAGFETLRGEPEAGVVAPDDDAGDLEASLAAADLVICQTGCLSHGAYWRVRDLCRRTGKTCVLVERPDALRIVRIRRGASA